ncbi:MAG: hypothetical protein EI684_06485 [Candidatus Viridilinea halotolerans]|uniref:Uncharacterized protein n=1 Tax=Candidatus Viridilinea halotolerans TaxID=2491704 RepID=A0A426U473_9CHLR|nr:MAG: hypothetical protein EI684_06485 [Candidatus Viridilinea halotolerans]
MPNKQVYELTLQANADGSFGYDYTMPADAQFGLYKIRLQDVTTGAWSTIAEYDVIDQAATDRPAITMALGPASALNDQPSELMIRGHNFAFGAVVRFGKHTLSTNWVSSELLQATVPSGLAPATYDLAVLNPNGHRATLPNGFRVLDPEAELNDDMFSSSDQLWLNPSSPQVNMPVELGLIVQRQGGKRALESVPVAFRLNAADGPLLGTATIPFLDPPNSSESTAALQVRFPSAGPVTIYAIIDPDNSFAENNDTNNIISRTIQVVPTNADQTVPVVQQIHVNNGSTSTVSNPELSLNITATDPAPGSGVVEAHVIEYVYNEGARRWVPVNQSNWMAFSASPQRYNWSLRSLPGMHYVQVRVRDRAGNVSIGNAHQMINYEVASDTIARGQKRIYRYNVAAGQPFQVNLEVLDGDADLYVWSSRTDQSAWVSNLSGSANEQVSVPANAVVPGVYQVEVYGFSSATYRLTTSSNAAAANLANGGGGIDPEKLVPSEPIVPVASIPDERVGTFPVSALPVDTDVQRVYLPLVRR